MSETRMGSYGIHLSLLDGMEEDLLLRLHNAGIATRDDLEAHLNTPEARRELARTLDVHPDRIEAVHHLNFVFPSDQAARLFHAERATQALEKRLAATGKKLNVAILGFTLAWTALLVFGWIWMQTHSASPQTQPVATSPAQPAQREAVGNTSPQHDDAALALTASEAQQHLEDAFRRTGPALGWSGPIAWSTEEHASVAGYAESGSLPRDALALSRALKALGKVEEHPDPAFSITSRAQAAAAELAALPPSGGESRWSLAANQVRLRLASLSQGLAAPAGWDPRTVEEVPWKWTGKGFLEAEWRLARLHTLPVEQASLPEWSSGLKRLQVAVNLGRDAVHPAKEAWAREVWLPRAQLELAVVGAVSGAGTLAPYSNLSPKAYVEKRVAYIHRAYQTAPAEIKSAMAWLYVEGLEARSLVAWLEAHPDIRAGAQGKVWVEAMSALDQERRLENGGPESELDAALTEALSYSGEPSGDAWASRRAAWEASMRPLLVETRAVLARLQGA